MFLQCLIVIIKEKKGMVMKRQYYLIAIALFIFLTACGGGGNSNQTVQVNEKDNPSDTNGTNKPTENEDTEKEQNQTDSNETSSSKWNVASTLYQKDLQKSISINGNECELTQNSSGIKYTCEGNLSDSETFSYEEIAKVVLPYLSSQQFQNGKEIVVAESNVTDNTSTFYYPPIIYKGKMYANISQPYQVDEDGSTSYHLVYEVNEYNLSNFTDDTTLETLISKHIVKEDTLISPLLSFQISSIMELNGYLYFPSIPNGEYFSAESDKDFYKYNLHKYNLDKKKEVYEKEDYGVFQHRKDQFQICIDSPYNNFSTPIIDGWMVPGNGTNIAFLHGEGMTEIDACSGEDIKVMEVGNVVAERRVKEPSCWYSVSVDHEDRADGLLFYKDFSISNNYAYFSPNGFKLSKTTFERQDKTHYGHSGVDKSVDVFDDFKTKYGNAKNYTFLQLQPEGIIDGDKIYLLATLNYGSPDGSGIYGYTDLYVFIYDTDLNLQEARLIIAASQQEIGVPEAYRFYKYGDNLFFKYNNDDIPELYSYNLQNHSIDFHYFLKKSFNTDSLKFDYAITGDTIVVPHEVKNFDDKNVDFDIVFSVLDIKTGKVLKEFKSDKLAVEHWDDYIFKTLGSYVYANSVYFVFEKSYQGYGDHYTHNLLVKINSQNNKTKITRYRGDNRLSGVIRNSLIESDIHPQNKREKLIVNLYEYLSGITNDTSDLNKTLLNYIADLKGVDSTASLFEIKKDPTLFQELNATVTEINVTKLISYDQTAPLYNIELNKDTQNFYIPLLKSVTYSSDGDDDGLGEARIKINAQYACTKSYFRFPVEGSVKIYGPQSILDINFSSPALADSLSFKTDVPMLFIDYNKMMENQTMLRYGIDAIEHDSLDSVEQITRSIKKNLDSLVSIAISIATDNYAAVACETANILTNLAIDSVQSGDTFYGSAMKIYTANSNFGIDSNQSFKEESIEGSDSSFTVDADSAGNVVENICSGAALDYRSLLSFATKADYDENYVKAKVMPTWHKGIEISHLKVEVIDSQFFHVPLSMPPHAFSMKGRIATLGNQNTYFIDQAGEIQVSHKDKLQDFQPFNQVKIFFKNRPYGEKGNLTDLNGQVNDIYFDADFLSSNSGGSIDSIAGIYLEMIFYNDNMQMGVFSDTLFLDEAIFTNNFVKSGKTYSRTITKPFYFPDQTNSKMIENGSITYKVTFTVE
jgi:hypothetical protein